VKKILKYMNLFCANVNFLADILVIFRIRVINKKPRLLPVYHNYCLSECFNFFKAYIAEAKSSKQRVQDEKEVGRLLLQNVTSHVRVMVLALCGQLKFKMAIIYSS